MQGKKALFLFLALALPVSIFIFLKFFGKNEFEVAPLYQDTAPTVVADCGFTYNTGYTLPDTVIAQLIAFKQNELYLIHFSPISSRMKEEIRYGEVTFVDGGTLSQEDQFKKCVLVIPANEDIVVVDNQGRIRGYFDSSDREDIDRLFLELEIILKKY